MRLSMLLALIRFSVAFSLLASSLLYAQQPKQAVFTPSSLQLDYDLAPKHRPPDSSSFNLIDLLSQSSQHTILLRLLQRVRLIPTLNRLQEFDDGTGITFLAPTDQAFLRKRDSQKSARIAANAPSNSKSFWEWILDHPQLHHSQHEPVTIWTQDGVQIVDNVNAVLRQHLLYHVLNYTLPYNLTSDTGSHQAGAPLPEPGKPVIHETMHFPSRRLLREPTRPGHIPRPDEEDHGGLLGHEGQKIRIATVQVETEAQHPTSESNKKKKKKDKETFLAFGADAKGDGGALSLGEDWSSPKGVIYTVDNVLDLPPSLQTVINTHPSLGRLQGLMTSDLVESLSTTAHLSLFLPASEAFASLSDLEWRFLSGQWQKSSEDRLKLMGWHTSGVGMGGGRPTYAHRLRKEGQLNITTILGGSVSVKVEDNQGISIGSARVVEEDIFTENGVVHIIDQLILPFGDLDMSVEKYLLALNATKFVDLIYEAGLESYISQAPHKGSEGKLTFLAPRDDVIEDWRFHTFGSHRSREPEDEGEHVSGNDAEPSLADVVKYHILPGLIQPAHLVDGMLLGTELRDWKLKDGRQRIPVEVDDGKSASERRGNGDVGFGNANVLREPVQVKDQAIIYVISQLLDPPANPVQTAVSHLSLSTFVATVFSAEMKKAIQRAPGVTYMIPNNDAFSGLGLAMSYLLLPESQPALQAVIQYHAIDQVLYLEDFPRNETVYGTLLPDPAGKLSTIRFKNGTVAVRRPDQGSETVAKVLRGDILTNTGVIHEIDRVQIPMDLTIRHLLKGAKADTMEDLIVQAGYGEILNGTLSQSANSDPTSSFVILVPTDNAFAHVNLSRLLESPSDLRRLVQQHIIPIRDGASVDDILPDGRHDRLQLRDESSFATLLDQDAGGMSKYGKVSFRRINGESTNSHPSHPFSEKDPVGWMVGIKDTRGSSGKGHSAQVLAFGRESRRITLSEEEGPRLETLATLSGMGGVIEIDSVIMPYEPGWFYRWGWAVLSTALIVVILIISGVALLRWWRRDGRIRLPEALEGEEE